MNCWYFKLNWLPQPFYRLTAWPFYVSPALPSPTMGSVISRWSPPQLTDNRFNTHELKTSELFLLFNFLILLFLLLLLLLLFLLTFFFHFLCVVFSFVAMSLGTVYLYPVCDYEPLLSIANCQCLFFISFFFFQFNLTSLYHFPFIYFCFLFFHIGSSCVRSARRHQETQSRCQGRQHPRSRFARVLRKVPSEKDPHVCRGQWLWAHRGHGHCVLSYVNKLKLLVLSTALVLTLLNLVVADLSPTPHTLLGTTKEDRASVMKWFSYANTDFWIALRDAMFPLIGRLPYNKEAVAAALQNTHSYVAVVEAHLQSRPHQHPYLVGDSATVADYMLVACLERGFQNIWGKDFIASHPAIHRYFENMLSQEPLNDLYPVPYPHRDEPLPNEPPQKAWWNSM